MRLATTLLRYASFAIGMALTACGGGADPGDPPAVTVATVAVIPTLDTLITVGGTRQFTATVRDADGTAITGRAVTWSSSTSSVATIASTGMVTAVANGTTTITASVDGVTGTGVLVVNVPPTGATIRGTVTISNALLAKTAASRRATGQVERPAGVPGKPAMVQRTTTLPHRSRQTSQQRTSLPGELIVTFRPQALGVQGAGGPALYAPTALVQAVSEIRAVVSTTVALSRATVLGVSPAILAARIRVADGVASKDVAAQLRANPAVLSVEPNYLMRVFDTPSRTAFSVLPNDPIYPAQAWHYTMIDLPRAWELTKGSAAVVVAVIDDGIRFDHPGVAGNLTNDGYDFVGDDPLPVCGGGTISNSGDGDGPDSNPTNPAAYDFDDVNLCVLGLKEAGNHGLHVAGTIGAVGNDGVGVTGVNWTVRIRPVRVMGAIGMGSNYDIAQGILYAAGLPADNGAGGTVAAPTRAAIINLSLGGPGTDAALQNAVAAATAAGSLLIVSAGNTPSTVPNYPAAYPEVVAVSAVGPDGALASYSSYGAMIDLAAPGGDISDGGEDFGVMSTQWNFQTNTPILTSLQGTSMASPHVAGVAALVLAANPGLTNLQLRARLENFAVDIGASGVDQQYGHGLVNARNALTQTVGPTTALKAFLLDATTGRQVQSVPVGIGGSYEFSGLAPGSYQVFAGEDEAADGLYGRPLRRWGAYGGTAVPTAITVSAGVVTTANFAVGVPSEMEDNNSLANADMLPVGGYLAGFIANPASDVDVARVLIPTAGTYTFETMPIQGACGFALEEDTVLELLSSTGAQLAMNDDINAAALNACSRITMTLSPGTYYVRTSGYFGPGASGIINRRYAVTARSGS